MYTYKIKSNIIHSTRSSFTKHILKSYVTNTFYFFIYGYSFANSPDWDPIQHKKVNNLVKKLVTLLHYMK